MPRTFDKLGVSFQYPDNWTLEEEGLGGYESVTVYSPQGGFWSVTIYSHSADPMALADTAVKAMREEYEELEIEEARQTVAGHELIGYDLNFYYLDLTNTAMVRSIRTDRATYTVFCQAEDREFDRIGAVFLAMTTSLLGGLDQLGPRG